MTAKRTLLERLDSWAEVLGEHGGGVYKEAADRIRELETEVAALTAASAPAPVVAHDMAVELKKVERAGSFLGWWRKMQEERS